jgi:hypothetical protein
MGAEFLLEGQSEPVLEVDDGVEWVLSEIGGWSYLFERSHARYSWHDAIISPPNLIAFADACGVLAEQYGLEGRVFTHSWGGRDAVHSAEVTGLELRRNLTNMMRIARVAHLASCTMTISGDRGWVESTIWQEADEAGPSH